jgi:hypothetical protein
MVDRIEIRTADEADSDVAAGLVSSRLEFGSPAWKDADDRGNRPRIPRRRESGLLRVPPTAREGARPDFAVTGTAAVHKRYSGPQAVQVCRVKCPACPGARSRLPRARTCRTAADVHDPAVVVLSAIRPASGSANFGEQLARYLGLSASATHELTAVFARDAQVRSSPDRGRAGTSSPCSHSGLPKRMNVSMSSPGA